MTDKTQSKKWNDESVAALLAVVGDAQPVSAELVNAAAEKLSVSTRSIASKLRQLDREVVSLAKERVASFTEAEGVALASFVKSNAGSLTYKDIAEQFMEAKFSPKQIQGKLLAMELTSDVKPAEKIEAAKQYTPEEEAQFVTMANAGAFIEDIAEALDKSVASIRGKALSLTRSNQIAVIPKQKESHKANAVDPVTALGEALVTMTVEQIAAAVDKTPRGVKTLLTRRGIKVSNYDGAAKKAKAEGKAAAVTA